MKPTCDGDVMPDWQLGRGQKPSTTDSKKAWQATLREDHLEIYQRAVARLESIFKAPRQFIHEKAPRHPDKAPRTTQEATYPKLRAALAGGQTQVAQAPQRLQVHGVPHQGFTIQAMETLLQEDCDQLTVETQV